MTPTRTTEIHAANARYHDLAAPHYDAKWAIDYGEIGRRQVTVKLAKALGGEPLRFARGLEIGAGTGYFGLNLLRAGVIERYTATDISPGMLAALRATADRLGAEVETARCAAEWLPFEDDSFDVVFGHAVLHHLPDLERAFSEMRRVLAPGGVVVFCGEPSHRGNRLAELPKRAAFRAAPLWRKLVGAPVAERNGHHRGPEEDELERVVDVHAFTPQVLIDHARAAGLEDVQVHGEELAASVFGWTNRALEATADPDGVPWLWQQYAYRGYLALQRVDRAVFEPRLPAALFYNLLVSARVPTS